MKEKITALFIICMIIALPVYSASVFAGINNVGIFGKDEVEGYRKESDLTYVKADVSISGDDNILPNQIFFNDIKFNNCRASEDYFTCILGINKNTLEAKTHSFTIKLKDDSENIVDTYAGTFVVDGKAPTIDSFSIIPKVTKKGNLTVKYSVRDYAYDTSLGSGLSKIVICKDDMATVVKEIKINGSSCLDSRELSFKTSDFVSSTGSADVCIAAYDMLNQVSELKCEKLIVDETKPEIEKNSLEIVDNQGNEINYISTKPKSAIVSVKIKDDSLKKVTADLSELNKDISSYSNMEAVCIKDDGVYECAWLVTIKLSDSGKVNIKINAEDGVGNSVEKSLSHTFKFDNKAPVVKSMKNAKGEYDNIKYVGKNNELVAEIEEKDSGFNLKKIWLLVGGEKIQADSCSESSGDWKCSFDNIGFNVADGSSVKVFISPNSEDDAGNSIDPDNSVLSETFILDSKAPVLIEEIEIKSLTNRTYSQDDILSGDKLHIKAVLKDKTSLTASADLSAIGLGKDEKTSCTKNETNWVCEWTTTEVASGPLEGVLKFKFIDFVENKAEKNINIKVLGVSDEENPNYWKIDSMEKMPLAIDRQTTELINQKTYVHLTLKPISPAANPSIAALGLDCKGDMGYIDDYELINEKSNDPYIVITLKQESMPNVSLSFNCSLLIISRVGDLIIQNTEKEPVDITIDFYNMPLGELSQNVKDKIKDAQDSWLVKQEWITTLEKILNVLEKLCKLIQTFGKINEVIADIELLASAFEWTGFVETIRPIAETTDKTYKQVLEYTEKYCKYISCDTTIWGGWYDDFSSKNTPEIFKEMRFSGVFWPTSPKDSIVLSLATGCIPGIIHGLQKRRQVECYYVLCLKKAADEGIPLSVCDEQKAYLECVFIYGEIFQVIPFAGFFKGLAEQFSMIVSDPLGLIFGGLNFYCEIQPTMAGHAVCVIGHLVPTLASIAEDIIGFADTESWWISGDVCEEALKPMSETTEEDTEETDEEEDEEE
ncbi:MAG: hypothetical protein KKA61_01445 [Nanoarchaeota archaeon]|nr:hypothetical protein [Nanoarchaeota archaeon]